MTGLNNHNHNYKQSFFANKRFFLMATILFVMIVFMFVLAFESANKNLKMLSGSFNGLDVDLQGDLQNTQKQIQEPFFMFSPVFYVPFALLLICVVALEIHRKIKEK